jgi:hypothetical protein
MMNKRLLTEMTDEELMEFERLLIRAENALKQKKPMTEEEIDEAIGSIGNLCVFRAGIRFAEKHHGIGGDDDKQG